MTKPKDAKILGVLENRKSDTDLRISLENLLGQTVSKAEGVAEGKKLLEGSGVYIVSACPGGCTNGGGQFRTQGFIKHDMVED